MRRDRENRNRSLIALFVLCAMFAVLFAGCSQSVAEESAPEPSTSEVESEVVSEEVSEPVSEEPSEEVISEEIIKEDIDLSLYTIENGKKLTDLVDDMVYGEFKVIVWRSGEGAKAILSDGDSYVIEDEDDFLFLYYPNQMKRIESCMDNAQIEVYGDNWGTFRVYGIGENMEVIFKGTDIDDKNYEIKVYITKDSYYPFE